MLLSIIMPCYNAEHVVKNAINSFLNQKYQNEIELIIINDGSTDNTKCVLDSFDKYSNIIIKTINNSGVSVARNIGIRVANGKYISFLDADDILHETYVDEIKKNIERFNFQILFFGYSRLLSNKSVLNTVHPLKKVYERDEYLYFLRESINNSYFGYICNKVFLSKILKDKKIFLNENLSLSEDTIFTIEFLNYTNNIVVINESLYGYTIDNCNSLSKKIRKDIVEQKILYYELFKKNLYNLNIKNYEDILAREIYYLIMDIFIQKSNDNIISINSDFNKSIFDKLINEFNQLQQYLNRNDFTFFENISFYVMKLKNFILLGIYFRIIVLLKKI